MVADRQIVCGERPRKRNGGRSAKCVRGATQGTKLRLIGKMCAGSDPGYIMEVNQQIVRGERPRVHNAGRSAKCVRGATQGT